MDQKNHSIRPRISVIVPVHNADEFIAKCLTSLTNQTFTDIEIVCVLNGSIDQSERIIKDFQNIDSRIICVNSNKVGVSAARNMGIEIAKGDYIAFVDADDWVDVTCYELVNEKLQQYDVDCLIFGFWNVFSSEINRNTSFDKCMKKVGERPFNFSDVSEDLLSSSAVCWNKIIRRDFLLSNQIAFSENLKTAEDTAFCVELYAKCSRLVFLDKELYFYQIRQSGNSVTTNVPLEEIAKSCEFCLTRLHRNVDSNLIINKFLSTLIYVYYSRLGCPNDKQAVQAIEELYKNLTIRWRLRSSTARKAFRIIWKFKLKSLGKLLFSSKKTEKYKYYVVLGVELNFQRFSYWKQFRKVNAIQAGYKRLLKELKERDEKFFRVGFVVSEIQKWKCQSLFELMEEDSCFEPMVIVVPLKEKNPEVCKNKILETQNYFVSKGLKTVVAWDFESQEALPLDQYNLDLVFYQQPWDIHKNHSIEKVSKKSLTYYVPYYVPNYGNLDFDCMIFHHLLFRYYVFNSTWKNLYLEKMKGHEANLCPVGHPMLDYYLENPKVEDKLYVIYAPHFSIQQNSIGYGTFDWSGKVILDFALTHPELNWIFKPHPKLKRVLVEEHLMTENEVEEYWNNWRKVGTVYEGGEYLPYFNDSKCLITDCGSFLVEYFYTGNPVIHLVSNRAEPPVPALKEIIDNYYRIESKESLISQMDSLILKGLDPLSQQRKQKLYQLGSNKQSSAEMILQDIKETLGLSL